jgi:hypothetical protein
MFQHRSMKSSSAISKPPDQAWGLMRARSWFVPLRIQSGELTLLAIGIAGWVVAVAFFAWRLLDLSAQFPGCFGLQVQGVDCSGGQSSFAIWDQTAEAVQWVGIAVPAFLGLFLGVPLVAREIEHGTAQIVWTVATSRFRWLFVRTLPIVVVSLILLAVAAGAGEVITRARLGGDDPGFQHYDQRGWILIGRGVVALAAGVFAGTWLGRQLPGVLVGLALFVALIVSAGLVIDSWKASEADLVRPRSVGPGTEYVTGQIIGPAAVLPNGTITRERNFERLPETTDFNWVLALKGKDLPVWVGRELAMDGVLFLIPAVGTVLLVRRRKPR